MQVVKSTEVNFSTLLRRLLQEHGHTQRDLAEKTGVTPAAVTKWLTKGAIPQGDVLSKISEIYDVTITGMLRGVEEPGGAPGGEMQFTSSPNQSEAREWKSRALLAEKELAELRGSLVNDLEEVLKKLKGRNSK